MFFKKNKKELSGWGRFPKIKTTELKPNSESDLLKVLNTATSYIPRGNGRSYGDSSINKNLTVTMSKMNKFISWNQETGELIAESGVLISDIIENYISKGWFPFVTAGTKFITLGGAIACDVHGKNHHLEGSFGNYVNWIEIVNNKNEVIRCSKMENKDLFNWTIGGMGLTGIILRCSIQLKKIESGWMEQKVIVNNNLNDTLESFHKYKDITYSVAWIDCLAKGKSFGRSLLMLGEHLKSEKVPNRFKAFPERRKQKISFPFDAPSFLLNNFTVSLFNKIYFFIQQRKKSTIVDWDTYFYPLDSISNWNRLYGKNGFFQFQCVLPNSSSEDGYKKILQLIQQKSSGSFLAVLKQFGEGNGYLSFPRKGFTLALDFKATKKNITLAEKLTKVVNNLGGSIYLAKDSIMSSVEFNEQIENSLLQKFKSFRNYKIKSEQSSRIKL